MRKALCLALTHCGRVVLGRLLRYSGLERPVVGLRGLSGAERRRQRLHADSGTVLSGAISASGCGRAVDGDDASTCRALVPDLRLTMHRTDSHLYRCLRHPPGPPHLPDPPTE